MGKRRLNPGSIIILGLLHLGAVVGLVRGASGKVWLLALAMWILTGLGVTVGYHRMETHGGFKTFKPVKWLLFALGAMTLQGQVREWVKVHWAHHKFQDQPGLDPHSPLEFGNRLKGLAWAHVGWLLVHYRPPSDSREVQLDRDPAVRWHSRTRNYLLMVAASLVIPALIAGWDGLWVAGLVRIVFGLHATWSVNSICHWLGTRAKDSDGNPYLGDDSRNNLFVAIVALGEGYHANHHAKQTWAYHGWRWYHWDPSKWVIRGLELTKLAWKVRKPKAEFLFDQALLTA